MNSDRPQDSPDPTPQGQSADDTGTREATGHSGDTDDAMHRETTVLVRGETVPEKGGPPPQGSPPNNQQRTPAKEISKAKVELRNRLPLLDDDSDVGIQKDHIVTRDGKADLSFSGTLLACVAPAAAPAGHWQEYRIYETSGGKHVFSKVTRTVFAEDVDAHEAEIFDPSPSSVPSQLLRGARDLARSRPLTWMDAAVGFFGYDPLAKALYRKLSGRFEEHIS